MFASRVRACVKGDDGNNILLPRACVRAIGREGGGNGRRPFPTTDRLVSEEGIKFLRNFIPDERWQTEMGDL